MNNEVGYIGNKNASTGRNAEILFKDSISEYPEVTESLKVGYKIDGDFSESMRTSTGGKCDVKLGFTCGRNIDASIKAYTGSGFNQITRWTVDNFAGNFNLSDAEREDLRRLVLEKSHDPYKIHLFSEDVQESYKDIIQPRISEIIRLAFSQAPSREIFVLFSRDESIMRIWKMRDVISIIAKTVDYTPKGNMMIGGCVELHRKGGNGDHVPVQILKTSPEHPGNNIGISLRVDKFINLHHARMLTQYQIYWG